MTPDSTDVVRPLRVFLEAATTAEVVPVETAAEVEPSRSTAEVLPPGDAEVRYRGL